MNTDGTQSKRLVEEPRGTILAVDYDPVENKVGDQADDVSTSYDECHLVVMWCMVHFQL